ncbi:NADH-quinone oxidoreductase subunit A [Pectinatus cerevisiiphilus]|uniref:NADH-quinone oxidoreductase subunit A n=1 Tax=Pectinatus cerevisiiphilus TaxID=86956 RepID=A0A4R3K8N7_9FIRM|nr:NADH-quinone oxidoreductase subunit A [Pectinatus cerevisiiphilus]TCS79366.1 NADH-quinone oxidoreductase subunit A [Pectinatus cerevisiiphilus]
MSYFAKIFILLIAATIFPIMAMIVPLIIQPRQPNKEKNSQYECGVDTVGRNIIRYRISYFLYAIIFVVFDVETIFLFPWAVKFNDLGLFALVEMFIFAGILAIGLAYAWKKGALTWK